MGVQRKVDLAGTLNSPDQAHVSAEAAGIVRSVLVEIGREVRAGDPLVKLETRELALAVERAESALRQTRAQLGMHGPIAGATRRRPTRRSDPSATRWRAVTTRAPPSSARRSSRDAASCRRSICRPRKRG